MRTIDQLRKLLNPKGEKNGKWTYVPVSYITTIGDIKDQHVELHAVYFDTLGGFMGAAEKCEIALGNDIADLKAGLTNMLKACDSNPTITNEELNLIRS